MIRNHITILREEEKTAQDLVDELCLWQTQIVRDGIPDDGQIKKYLLDAEQQVNVIRQRIIFLEEAVEQLAAVKQKIGEMLDDGIALTKHSANGYDGFGL